MIVRKYGSTVQSVEPNFDARAMNEIGFLRSGGFSLPVAEFLEQHEREGEHEVTAETEGGVKDEVEHALLESLREKLAALEREAGEGAVLLIENEPGKDYPKTRDRTKGMIVEGQNRLYFYYTVDPPVRVGVYRRRGV